MRSHLCASFVLGIILSGGFCRGDTVVLSAPLEVNLVYEGGLKVTLRDKQFIALELLRITNGKETSEVPSEELKDIYNPILSKVLLTGVPVRDGEKGEIAITLEFDVRPYPWGNAPKTAKFFFKGGKYSHRWVTNPTGRDTWTIREKRTGEPETDFSSGGVLPAVQPDEVEKKEPK